MHFARTRKRLTAWLGLAAMVLVFFAPVVSQALALHSLHMSSEHAMSHSEVMPMATADSDMPAGHVMMAGHAMPAGHDMPAGHHMPADHHAACGYCDLLAHHVPAPVPIVPMAALAPAHATTRAVVLERLAAREARRAGRPRDSPFLT